MVVSAVAAVGGGLERDRADRELQALLWECEGTR